MGPRRHRDTKDDEERMDSAFLANCGKVYMRHPDPRVCLIGTQDEVLMMSDDSITMTLSRQEALVLFDWLASLDDGNASSICDDAQQQVVWAVEGRLEKVLTEVLAPDYTNIISNAKTLRAGSGRVGYFEWEDKGDIIDCGSFSPSSSRAATSSSAPSPTPPGPAWRRCARRRRGLACR